jgi:colanic acid biosynthesis glycosyl transferase WcaI
MRILILNQFFYPDSSATSQLMTDLAEDLVRHGIVVTALCGTAGYTKGTTFSTAEWHRGMRVVRVRSPRFTRSSTLRRAISYLSFHVNAFIRLLCLPAQDAILVLTTPPLIAIVACFIKAMKGTRVVYLLQDLYPDLAVQLGILRAGSFAARFLEVVSRLTLRYSDAVVVLGHCMAARVRDKGVSAERISVIQNWADSQKVYPVPREHNCFLDEHELRHKFVVMYSGNLGKVHDLETILEAVREFKDNPQISFVFIGDGAQKVRLEAFVRQHALENVLLLPYCDRNKLRFSLSAANVSLVSQVCCTAGLSVPSKLYGIMAAGTPVIFVGPSQSEAANTVRASACGYVVGNGDVPALKNAILRLRDDTALADKMAASALKVLRGHFDRPILTRCYLDLLHKLLADQLKGELTQSVSAAD